MIKQAGEIHRCAQKYLLAEHNNGISRNLSFVSDIFNIKIVNCPSTPFGSRQRDMNFEFFSFSFSYANKELSNNGLCRRICNYRNYSNRKNSLGLRLIILSDIQITFAHHKCLVKVIHTFFLEPLQSQCKG